MDAAIAVNELGLIYMKVIVFNSIGIKIHCFMFSKISLPFYPLFQMSRVMRKFNYFDFTESLWNLSMHS